MSKTNGKDTQNWLKAFNEDPYKQDDILDDAINFFDDDEFADMPMFGFPTAPVNSLMLNSSNVNMSVISAVIQALLYRELLLLCCCIVIFCQIGFGLYHGGLSRSKNCLLACFVVVLNTFLVFLGHWGAGYTFGYTNGTYMIGYTNDWFSESMTSSTYLSVMHSLCIVLPTINIIPGGLLERVHPHAYVTIAILFSVIVHPMVVHSAWHPHGWLQTVQIHTEPVLYTVSDPMVVHSAWHPQGWLQTVQIHTEPVLYKDFAGSGIVHIFAGSASLIGSIMAGPRFRKFSSIRKQNFNSHLLGHSSPLHVLGGFFIIFGFIILHISRAFANPSTDGASIVVLNTLIATIVSAMTSFVLVQIIRLAVKYCCWELCKVKWPVMNLFINGALAGIAAIAAGCDVYYPWGSAVVGFVAGSAYVFWSFTIAACCVDDPADVFATHAGGGFWGVIAVNIFGRNGIIFYTTTTNYKKLAWNIVGGASIAVWAALLTCLCLLPFRLYRHLCLSYEKEMTGLDVSIFGELAYPLYAWKNVYEEDGNSDVTRLEDEPKQPWHARHLADDNVRLDSRHTIKSYHF